jgi:hypothetical protein
VLRLVNLMCHRSQGDFGLSAMDDEAAWERPSMTEDGYIGLWSNDSTDEDGLSGESQRSE